MSKVSLAGNASGTGIFTIASPNSNTDRTLTLPDQTGTLLSSSAQGIPKTALPTGSVLQVVSVASNTQVSTTSSTYVSTGFSASITPTSSTSKILVMYGNGGAERLNNNGANAYIQIWRGGSSIFTVTNSGMNLTYSSLGPSVQYLDSPATTSSTTYTIYYKTDSNTFYLSTNTSGATLTLMEIAA
jgi:hypothetical protein